MTITINYLTGTRENLDIVIAAHLSVNWSSASTASITPVFEPISYTPSMSVEDDSQTSPNTIRTSVINRFRTTTRENEPNGDNSHMWISEVQIDLWAETVSALELFEDEVNRILWTIRPNETTRLKKSTGVKFPLAIHATANSEVEAFEDTEINFEFLGNDGDDSGSKVGSQGILRCVWFKNLT